MRRTVHTARWVAISVALVVAVLVGVLATRQPAETRAAESPLLGHAAPDFSGTALDGAPVRLSAFRGRYVLVNFFASWCVPCRREHDALQRFHLRHTAAGDGLVVGVLFDDEPADARRFFAQHGGTWQVVADPRGVIALDFGVRGPPESFLVDPQGFVLTRLVGEVDDAGLERLLAQAKAAAELRRPS